MCSLFRNCKNRQFGDLVKTAGIFTLTAFKTPALISFMLVIVEFLLRPRHQQHHFDITAVDSSLV